MVIGADTHKETHTCAAVEHASGQFVEELTARGRRPGFEELLVWGRRLGSERVWALEDCRHVSGPFERFLLPRGERVVRVAPKFMGEARKSQRERGKSDSIDALAVARAVIREGADNLPVAQPMSARWRSSCCSIIARTRVWRRSICGSRPMSLSSLPPSTS
jgi:transposase